MRIAIDARDLCGQRTGVGRYLGEVVRAWAEMPEARMHEWVFCAPGPLEMPEVGRLTSTIVVGHAAGLRWEQLVLPRLVREARADVLLSPSYSSPLRGDTPTVLVIHDVSYCAHPEWFSLLGGLKMRTLSRLSEIGRAHV